MEALEDSQIATTVFFYNPNIHPVAEYELRKNENKGFCDKLNFPFIDADYEVDAWFDSHQRVGERTGARAAVHRLF